MMGLSRARLAHLVRATAVTSLLTTGTLAFSSLGASAARPALVVIPRVMEPRAVLHAKGAYRITAIAAVELPPTGATDSRTQWATSKSIASFVLMKEVPRILGHAPVETVTGASFTSVAFEKSLQGALIKFRQTSARKATELGTIVPVTNCKPIGDAKSIGNGMECFGGPPARYGVLRLRVSFVAG